MPNFTNKNDKSSTNLSADKFNYSPDNINRPLFTPEMYLVNSLNTNILKPQEQAPAPSVTATLSSGVGINFATTLDRIVENFGQGGIGDCWYLAAIKSLSVSTLGSQSLYNAINFDTTNASITFKGAANYKYSSTLAALTSEVNDGDTYTSNGHSSGDADTLLLEMALKGYVANTSYKNSYFTSSPYTGGWMSQALELVTGKLAVTYDNWSNNLAATSAKLDELAQIIDHTAITAGCMYQANPSLDIAAASHAYSIVAIDTVNKMVSFRNPWYSGTALKQISYANFSYYFQRIDYVDLSTNNLCMFASNLGGTINGGTGNDLFYGGTGNDILNGGTGVDTMIGRAGNDTYYVDTLSDIVTEYSNEGTDKVISSITYTLGSNLENLTLSGTGNINGTGNSFNNIITGNSGNNSLYGGTGIDTMIGGLGNDTYYVDNASDVVTENINEGTDIVLSSITYTLGNNIENLTLSGTGNISGTGNTLNNIITGNSGNNTLNGAAGNDTMIGSIGNDTYYVDSTGDVVVDVENGGTDTVISSITYALGNNIENLTLSGTGNINATGNALNNIITGNSGNNIFNSGAGNDTMIGGLGNDTYYIDATGDVITESASGGTDTVYSSITYTLGSNIENLTLSNTGNINGTGNALNNIITGNSGNNSLYGGAGIDTMIGGLGNDIYYVDNASDIITENASAGTDTVFSTITYTLGNNLENLTLYGTANINGTGNTLNNIITGNAGNNTLNGGAGNDTYYTSGGKDIISDSSGSDIINLGSNILKQSVAFFKQGLDLIIGSTNGDRITVLGQSNSATAVEKVQLASGEFLTNTDVNLIIQQMASYATGNGIQLSSVDNVLANQNLMTLVSNAWHAA